MEASQKSDPRRVLVVDDNPAVLKLIGSLFEEEGMAVRLAKNVPEARAALNQPGERFDLVLSDIQMPGESGFDLLDWIKRQAAPLSDVPVLLTTAQLPEAENRLKGLAMGAVDYVVRPIELKELVVRAVNAIAHYKQVQGLETMLQKSESLAMTGRLLAASTHEIKNLASLVNLCSTRLKRSFEAGQGGLVEQAEVLRCLAESSALLTDVAKNVSSLLDPSASATVAVDLDVLIEDVARLMRARIRPILLDTTQPAAGSRFALAHPVRLKQVLINLILNAADAINEFSPDQGGRISVRLGEGPGGWHLTVADNGIGFRVPGERTEFEAFSTTKKLRGGQGLGLWLCSRLVQSMGGALKLASDGVGRGATATVALKKASPSQVARDSDFDLAQYLID